MHISQNAEALRSKFVSFDGKQQLVIQRENGHLLNNPDFTTAFAEWADQIKENIGPKNYFKLMPHFSTTNALAQQVFDTQLMKMMDSYFEYVMMCGCGIPRIKFLGTIDDW